MSDVELIKYYQDLLARVPDLIEAHLKYPWVKVLHHKDDDGCCVVDGVYTGDGKRIEAPELVKAYQGLPVTMISGKRPTQEPIGGTTLKKRPVKSHSE